MDHEGPNTRMNTQKRATAAEQITKLHDDYEARGQPSSDKMVPVLTHNEKYPKLREQLDRRRSDADVSDVDKARTPHVSRSHRKRPAPTKPRDRRDKNLSRVTKKRSRNCTCTCSKCLPAKLFTTKSCQITNYVTVINRRIGTDLKAAVAEETQVAGYSGANDTIALASDVPIPTKPVGSEVGSRNSGIASICSFRSCYSTDHEHEPMV